MAVEKTFRLKLDFFATQGAYHALMNTEVKGRSSSRNHSRVLKLVRDNCMKMNDGSQIAGDFVGGEFDCSDDQYTYLSDIAKKKLETGVPGSIGEGYSALMDALDESKVVGEANKGVAAV